MAQSRNTQLSLEAFFIEAPQANAPTRLWLKITNRSARAEVLCRPSWGYSWISDDPQAPSPGEAKASLHGCGDDDHDPLWFLLPGESRIDSYEIPLAGASKANLEVDVEVTRFPTGALGQAEHETLSWKGTIADAIALGLRLKGR